MFVKQPLLNVLNHSIMWQRGDLDAHRGSLHDLIHTAGGGEGIFFVL